MRDVVPFTDPAARAVGLAGGKAASLATLIQAGFPVPPGFVVAAPAQREDGRLDEPLAEAIRAAYRALGAGDVAVRSSATTEDGAEASFAGQHETYLHVRGEDDVLVAVQRCWESLGSERAVAYRAGRDGMAGARMAVVVQTMAPHAVSGVVFTVNPLTGSRDELLVNAVAGVGEKLVGGEVVPDQWVARRPDGAVLSFQPARRLPAGPMIARVPVRGVLESDHIRELATLALRVEALFGGAPQDIEWSYGSGCFHLLQARPVTAFQYS